MKEQTIANFIWTGIIIGIILLGSIFGFLWVGANLPWIFLFIIGTLGGKELAERWIKKRRGNNGDRK